MLQFILSKLPCVRSVTIGCPSVPVNNGREVSSFVISDRLNKNCTFLIIRFVSAVVLKAAKKIQSLGPLTNTT